MARADEVLQETLSKNAHLQECSPAYDRTSAVLVPRRRPVERTSVPGVRRISGRLCAPVRLCVGTIDVMTSQF